MASNNIAQFVFLNLPTANKKTKLETNTAASPTTQDFPIPITIVYENNALYPIPGAIARGYLEKKSHQNRCNSRYKCRCKKRLLIEAFRHHPILQD